MNYYYLSLSDLLLIDGFRDAHSKGFKYIKHHLYASGLDTSQKIEISEVLHRNLRNQAVRCKRYCGFERTDREWINSGMASLEAIIASSRDNSLKQDLRFMSRETAIDRAFDGPLYEVVEV